MTLTEVATQYRTEGCRRRYPHPDRQAALAMANWLDEAVANRTPDDHHVTLATQTWLTTKWVQRHGYQIAATSTGTGIVGLILQRGDELLIVNLPAHLHWDGQRITLADDPAAA